MEWVAVVGIAFAVLGTRTLRQWAPLFVVALALLGSFSRYALVVEPNDRTWVVDMSSGGFAVSTVALAIFTMLLTTPSAPSEAKSLALFVLPMLAVTGLAYLLVWEHTPDVRGGIVAVVAATAAWFLGGRLATRIGTSIEEQRTLAIGLLLVLVMQLAFAVVQYVGNLGFLDGRADGTFSHPAWLGKFVLILLPLLLPLASSPHRKVQRPAVWAIGAGLIATGLTVSRANLIAIVAVLIGWAIVRALQTATNRPFRRIWLPLAVLVIVTPFVSVALERFLIDPEGGDREALGAAGERVIAANPWFGVAPNNFVNVAARTEDIIRFTGFPVHNSFLYGAATLGFVGAFVFALPLISSLWRAASSVRRGTIHVKNTARGYLLCMFGIGFVGLSGWGLWQDPMLILLFLTSGYVFASLRTGPEAERNMTPTLGASTSGHDLRHTTVPVAVRQSRSSSGG